MNPLTVTMLSLQMMSAPQQRPQLPPDLWIAEDKLMHMLTSASVVGFGHAGTRMFTDARGAIIGGIIASAAAGLWKEMHDKRTIGRFSKKDLVWDAIGIGLGAALMSKAR